MEINHEEPSNRTTPIYYKEFRNKVLRGDIPVNQHISQEMNRIDNLISNPDIYYDSFPVEGFINFCEAELTKTDGSGIKLLDTFKLWGEQLFGWYYYTTRSVYDNDYGDFVEVEYLKRLISKQYLIVARGAAKSMYAAFIQGYFLTMDGETTHQITTAPTMKQAEEVIAPLRTAITRAPGPLFKFLTTQHRIQNRRHEPMLLSTKKGLESRLTGSLLEIRPMSVAKLQGLRPKVSTIDEWLSGDVREDVVGAIEQGASKLEDYIIVACSSEGTVRNGSGDGIKLELLKILSGEYDDPHTSIFYYRLDSIDEVATPEKWEKAQPNIGKTVTYETYARDVRRAEKAPSTRNDILAKRFGIPMEGYTYFFTYEETIAHKFRSYNKMACSMGVDLSQGDDFCAFTFLFPLADRSFGVKTVNFISERVLKILPPASRIKYEEFIDEKSLIVLEGTYLDMQIVYETIQSVIDEREYVVDSVGYDPYNAEAFIKYYTQNNGPLGISVVRQGARTESVPLGELKAMTEDRVLLFDESIFSYAMGNTMVMEDTNGNRKLYKRRYDSKIDPVSALLDAYVAYTREQDLFF
jgi:phage terminase large subunit-like protein